MKIMLPIGIDSFREVREEGRYYADKTLMIKDFIESNDKVTLITRPRRFGKTLSMTMIREFFDITADSRAIFNGLAIMDTQHAGQINSRPVIYFTFKDCKGYTAELLYESISSVVMKEYDKYFPILKGNINEDGMYEYIFFDIYEKLRARNIGTHDLQTSIEILEIVLSRFYGVKPIILIDEYDQPLICSFEYGYHDEVKLFFSGFYGSALKGQEQMHKALLTGIQRVVKESIFSQLNSIRVYTVLDKQYSGYFGLTENETGSLLTACGLALDDDVKQKYDGYQFGNVEMYNPWSILNYADTGSLERYWINTSTNFLVKSAIDGADEFFRKDFDMLISEGTATVMADLANSFTERQTTGTLWGLLVNSGYVTVAERLEDIDVSVRIPNGEVRSEFMEIVADQARVGSNGLQKMFRCLINKDIDGFFGIYRELVISCTSYFDAKENAYHMLFLGMCLPLHGLYKITSNIESGFGRSDIRMESLTADRPHIILEFKQGEDIDILKNDALQQILDNEYYAGLQGSILCAGIAHDKKKCAIAHKTITH